MTYGTQAPPTRGSFPKAGTRKRSRPKMRTTARACQPAPHDAQTPYERRRPEETTLYQVVQDHVETFFAQVEQETGTGLPQFVKDEFEAFLECGILAHGFLRLRCGDCAHDTLVAFSCKRRGFCPACGARRMAETAAHLVDHVIPRVPVRQWVVSFPIPLRYLFATQPQLLSPVLQVIHRALSTFVIHTSWIDPRPGPDRRGDPHPALWLRRQSQHSSPLPGARWRLSPHWRRPGLPVHTGPHQGSSSRPSSRGSSRAVMKALTRQGALIEEDTASRYLANPDADPALAPLHAAACTYRIALGPPSRPKSADVERPRLAPRQPRGTATPGLCQCPGV